MHRHLPDKGQPLDLRGYFHADPEQRVAGRLIRDNDILPQPLQDRRDAEIHREQVSALIEKTRLELSVRRFNIEQLGA
ncbi:MAG: DnaJ family domain-containing protein, partial [Candidatus Latescibacterota bacterium]|nr:DnaJ family domain-containing protein [Candidatus Latescibacterota bacterium]